MSWKKLSDKNIEIVYNPEEGDRYVMPPVYGFINTASKVKTIVDEKNRQIISYYWDHLNCVWVKSIYNMPSDFVVVHAPLTYNSNSSWRSFKSFLVLPYKAPVTSKEEEPVLFRQMTDIF